MGPAIDPDQSTESQGALACLPASATSGEAQAQAQPTPSAPGPAETASQSANPILASASPPSMLERIGEGLGVGAGVAVTEGLSLLPSWNAAVLGTDGKPVASVPGADRIGDHDIEKRHEEDIGPKVAGYADGMQPGALHDLVSGFGAGATQAPGDSYRLEAGISDMLTGK